jgi:hypothetical protein
MKNRFALTSLMVLLLGAWVALATADAPPVIKSAHILKAGRYEARRIKRQPGSGQKDRRNLYAGFKFIDEATRIPGIKGYRFGLRFVILGEPRGQEIEIRIFRHHPPVKDTSGKKISRLTTYTQKAQLNAAQVIGYGFDHDWELVPGEHRFQVYYGPKKLLEQVFTVYRP